MKKLLERHLKDFDSNQQKQLMALVEKNPQFFTTLAAAIQIKMSKGKDQMSAIKEVIEENKSELQMIASDLK